MAAKPNRSHILVVDDEENLRHLIRLTLEGAGHQVSLAESGEAALALLNAPHSFDLCLTDIRMPKLDGLGLVRRAHALPDAPRFVVMSAFGDEDVAVSALQAGAFDFISKPFDPQDLQIRIRLLTETQHALRASGKAPSHPEPANSLQVLSETLRKVRETALKAAVAETPVLLTGETGTGKELFAREIHAGSPRASGPFIAVNCGALPDTLVERELFGNAAGAFTDALEERRGLFAQADGGTLFLDEIGELPLNLQPKLLRVLVDGEIRPLGSERPLSVDVRLISATSRNLHEEATAGQFRSDLYYRLAVVELFLPALRDRREEIAPLAQFFAARFAERLGKTIPRLTEDFLNALQTYDWPGNVRELENTVQRALVLQANPACLQVDDLDPRFFHPQPQNLQPSESQPFEEVSVITTLKEATQAAEKRAILAALQKASGNRQDAAKLLGISVRSLLYKIKDHSIT